MGNDDNCLACLLHHLHHNFHLIFGNVVQRRSGFVQNNNLRILIQGACYGNPLPFAAREVHAVLAYLGFVSFGLAFDEFLQTESFPSKLYPYHLGMQFAHGYVFGDGAGEKLYVLGHGADALAQASVVYFGVSCLPIRICPP